MLLVAVGERPAAVGTCPQRRLFCAHGSEGQHAIEQK
jgi:hypothetical protein